jgi:hypothetical protein
VSTVAVARLLLFVREAATRENNGPWVEAIQRVTGNKKGDPWCASFVCFVLTLSNRGKNPLPTTASCEEIHKWAKKYGKIVSEPREGDVFLVLNADDWAHHTGFCTGPAANGLVPTIEGNTNVDGSRDGYGVFERQRKLGPKLIFVRP